MNRLRLGTLTLSQRQSLCERHTLSQTEDIDRIRSIIEDIQLDGDAALRRYTKEFDRISLHEFKVSDNEFLNASSLVSERLKNAMTIAFNNISAFHSAQIPSPFERETQPGVICRREWRAIPTVGLYVPGGSAPLLSTVLMLGIPATLAGCKRIILCTPPSNTGTIAPEILYAARMAGIQEVYKAGGAQAIAGMAVGTTIIPKVDKIFGPGNRYVAIAKGIVAQPPYNIAIDMAAGPTELLIIADASANPSWIASDMIAQAEHGSDSRVLLLSTSKELDNSVLIEIERQSEQRSRKHIIEQALDNCYIIDVMSIEEAITFSNEYAPEHLLLATDNAGDLIPKIHHAGSVFIGQRSSVVFGDYASGANHTLPTAGTARASGGLTVESFMKPVTFQTVSREGAAALAITAEILACAEQLDGHAYAAGIRKGGHD